MRPIALVVSVLLLGTLHGQVPRNRLVFGTGLNWYAPMNVEPAAGQPVLVEGRVSVGNHYALSYSRLLKNRWSIAVDGGLLYYPMAFTMQVPLHGDPEEGWRTVRVRWESGRVWLIGLSAAREGLIARRWSWRASAGAKIQLPAGVERTYFILGERDETNDTTYSNRVKVVMKGITPVLQLRGGVFWRGARYNEWGLDVVLDLSTRWAYTGSYRFSGANGQQYTGTLHLNASSLGFRLYRTFSWGKPKLARWMVRAKAQGVPLDE